MIQDIYPAVFDNHYEAKKPDADSPLMFVRDDDVLFKKEEDGKLIYPLYGQCDPEGLDITYLFSIDDTNYFLAREEEYSEEEIPQNAYGKQLEKLLAEGFEFKNRMNLRYGDKCSAFAGATAYQLAKWYADNRICGRCGKKLHHAKEERMMHCESCGNMIYPKICPAVIVAVTDGDKLLLTKYSTGYKRFALIAGFAESGETIEETVHREVMEEVGLKVKNLRYYKSQPWTFTDTLLFGFFCDVDKDNHITMDEKELSYANWLSLEELEEVEDDEVSLTREMIRVFKESRA